MTDAKGPWYRFCQAVAQGLFVALFRIRVYYRERLPAQGGVLVVSNHQSYLDPILAAVGMGRAFHPMARESLFRFRPFAWLVRSLYAFPVRRGRADLRAIREALRRLRAGRVVLMFPEGTRTRDGSIGQLHGGPATVAARAGAPLVPAVIDGSFEAWPRWRLLPRPHPVRVAFGEPVAPEAMAGRDPEEVMAVVRETMVGLQTELRARARRDRFV